MKFLRKAAENMDWRMENRIQNIILRENSKEHGWD
jgi:hypothetical protein